MLCDWKLVRKIVTFRFKPVKASRASQNFGLKFEYKEIKFERWNSTNNLADYKLLQMKLLNIYDDRSFLEVIYANPFIFMFYSFKDFVEILFPISTQINLQK